MNGIKPNFLRNKSVPEGYYSEPNPYASAPKSDVNLKELSRYAKISGKKLTELSESEVEKFSV